MKHDKENNEAKNFDKDSKEVEKDYTEDNKRIALLQYKSLRENFSKNLVTPILGKDYYNMANDVYTCDRMTTEDLLYEFNKLKKTNLIFKLILSHCLAAVGGYLFYRIIVAIFF